MKEVHVLFTGAGRRVELFQAFRNAALCLNVNLKIHGIDIAGSAPALTYCNYVKKICAMKEADYIPELLEICRVDKIDLLIPTIDTDLLVLSQNIDKFKEIGTRVLISSHDKILLCRDKNYTSDFFEICDLKAPRPVNDYHKYKGEYPCFIKPKDGSSNINAYKVNAKSELSVYAKKIGDYIIQPFIDGKEYTVDIFCDFDANPIYITPRERIAVRGGEVLKTRIELDEKIIKECRRLIQKFKPCGPITVQLIRQNTTGDDYYIEINPRYGGGAPLSIKAGADSAAAVLRLLQGEKLEYQENAVRDGALYSRFDQSICIVSESKKTSDSFFGITGVIFDLDDTLYSEKQYVKSGYRAVAEFLAGKMSDSVYSKDESHTCDDSASENESNGKNKGCTAEIIEEKLWNYFLNGKNAIDELLDELSQSEVKTECLDIYRNHMPKLKLYDGVHDLLVKLKDKGIKIGIITDGRVNGQKNKIKALGLTELVNDIIITDELGGEQFRKPNDISFRIMQCRWRQPFEKLAYVGDNVMKDFQAPKQLGMRSIYFRNEDGLYYNEAYDLNECDMKIEDLSELEELCKQ